MWDPNKDVQKYSQFKQKCVRKLYFQGSIKTRLGLNLFFLLEAGGGGISVTVVVTLQLPSETRNKCFGPCKGQWDPVQKNSSLSS